MQNARDSFYVILRNRLAARNPARTVLLRGAIRPGILVEDAESPFSQLPPDVFVLRWSATSIDPAYPLFLARQTCELVYATEGSAAAGGLDRGRALAEMDAEAAAILQPMWTPKMNYVEVPAQAMLTNVYWSDPEFGATQLKRDRLERTVTVSLFSHEEPGEQA
jgi:hypothetical protein